MPQRWPGVGGTGGITRRFLPNSFQHAADARIAKNMHELSESVRFAPAQERAPAELWLRAAAFPEASAWHKTGRISSSVAHPALR
eukprot:306534-Prorocentrum_minimum.AAC.3